jgi:hypothetical protein
MVLSTHLATYVCTSWRLFKSFSCLFLALRVLSVISVALLTLCKKTLSVILSGPLK